MIFISKITKKPFYDIRCANCECKRAKAFLIYSASITTFICQVCGYEIKLNKDKDNGIHETSRNNSNNE